MTHKRAKPAVDAWGILDAYEDSQHSWHRIGNSNRAALRRAMGGSGESDGEPVWLVPAGQSRRLRQPAELQLENGVRVTVKRELPATLPIGYHTLREAGSGKTTRLMIVPQQCHQPVAARESGWALQLYALRSRDSWGIGDFADLRRFARWSRRKTGAGFILLNPLGAPLPLPKQEASPYSLSSRLFLNPLYLCVEELLGVKKIPRLLNRHRAAGRALNAGRLIDRDAIFRLKSHALEAAYKRFRGAGAFDRFCAEGGETLDRFAAFSVLAEHYGGDWRRWPRRVRHPASPGVLEFIQKNRRRLRFHQWLQWQLDTQLARASRELPLMLDLPVGINPGGFDAWLWQDALALDVAVGAPPDTFNTLGQNWGLPPFIPHRLRASGYEPFRQTIRAMLRHARGLRIDHVLGLFRLYWIPRGRTPRDGGYVRYCAEELLAVLAIESHRAKATIVGEDLGTVERGVRLRLRKAGVLSYCLLWFENRLPDRYPDQALAAVTTHDLFTVAGLWSGKDIAAQERMGRQPNAGETEAVLERLRRRAGLPKTASAREAIVAAHRLLARAPCRLLTVTLDDALAVEERPNMPATTTEWPNWCIALPKPLEEIQRDEFVQRLMHSMTRANRGAVR